MKGDTVVLMDGQRCPVCRELIVWVPSPFSVGGERLVMESCACQTSPLLTEVSID